MKWIRVENNSLREPLVFESEETNQPSSFKIDRKPGDKREKQKAKNKVDSFGKGNYQELFPQLGAPSKPESKINTSTKYEISIILKIENFSFSC